MEEETKESLLRKTAYDHVGHSVGWYATGAQVTCWTHMQNEVWEFVETMVEIDPRVLAEKELWVAWDTNVRGFVTDVLGRKFDDE
jgi:hypothetical protein